MRLVAIAGVAALALGAAAVPATADVHVVTQKRYYGIAGRSGEALLKAMDRSGPKHGFLARAIAQTRYTVGWEMSWTEQGGRCRLSKANAELAITYIYPKVTTTVSPEMSRRWARFIKGVTRHEEVHGRIAREMAQAAERAVRGLRTESDPGCRKAKREAKRRVDAIYARYERRQVLFDEKEHGKGGQVEGLVALLRGRG